MMKLVQSSDKTRKWLQDIQLSLKINNLDFESKESKYWCTFRRIGANKVFSHCNPSAKKILVFLPFKENEYPDLTQSPSIKHWAMHYPTIFIIESEKDIKKALDLLIRAYRMT